MSTIHFISIFFSNYRYRRLVFWWPKSFRILRICQKLFRLHLIKSFTVVNNYRIFIALNYYRGFTPLLSFYQISKQRRLIRLSAAMCYMLLRRYPSAIFLISSTYGITALLSLEHLLSIPHPHSSNVVLLGFFI